MMDKESIYGYHNNNKTPFLKIYVSLQKLIAPARRILENGFSCPGYSLKSYTTYESNIDFEVIQWALFNVIYLPYMELMCLVQMFFRGALLVIFSNVGQEIKGT